MADVFERVRLNPVAFVRDELGFEPWSKQREVLEALRDHNRVAVRSAHATGKTAGASAAVMWWLAGGPGSVAVTTAPTWRQVKKLLWREISRRYRHAGRTSRLFADATLLGTELELADDWYAVGVSTDDTENFQGWHAERMLVVVDEASGVDEGIFEAIEGVLAGGDAKVLLIGNPTRTSGQFYRAFHSERALWKTIAISAFDTPALTGERVSEAALKGLVRRRWVDEKRVKWGEGSPLWDVRVCGRFPSQGDDAVVSLGAIDDGQLRCLEPGEPVIVSCDVARFGSDETVIVTRRGPVVRIAKTYVGRSTMQTVREILAVAREVAVLARVPKAFVRLVIDDAGLGGGVTDRLRELDEFAVVAFNGAETAFDPDAYPNRRSEAWFRFAEKLPELDLDVDEQLAADLAAPLYELDGSARRVVEPKKNMKRRLGRSPDRADAVVMAVDAGPAFRLELTPAQQAALERRRREEDGRVRQFDEAFERAGGESLTGGLLETQW